MTTEQLQNATCDTCGSEMEWPVGNPLSPRCGSCEIAKLPRPGGMFVLDRAAMDLVLQRFRGQEDE